MVINWWTLLLTVACTTADPVEAAAPVVPSTPPEVPVAPPPEPEAAAPSSVEITDRLLPWTEERTALTAAYLRAHRTATDLPDDDELLSKLDPKLVVLHWTAGPTADGAWNTFAPTRLRGRAEIAGAGALNVSAHFLVDRDGSISRLVPEDRVARHVIGLNHVAIGVENVGGGESWPLTEAQMEANAALVRHLAGRHPGLTHLIAHREYRAFEGHALFEEQDPGYRTTKPDPDEAFMTAVRARVQDLALAGPPSGTP